MPVDRGSDSVNENDIDTRAASVARHPQLIKEHKIVYVNPLHPNASDTAYLFTGKAGTEDYPFASLNGALVYFTSYFYGRATLTVVLQADVSIDGLWVYMADNFTNVVIQSDNNQRKITTSQAIQASKGSVDIRNLTIEGTNTNQGLFYCSSAYGYSIMLLTDLTLTGTAMATVYANNKGNFIVNRVTGNITGVRYRANNGSMILVNGAGANAIPGSQAGIVDSSSVYN